MSRWDGSEGSRPACPVLMGITLLSILTYSERLGGCIPMGSVDVNLHLVNGV